MALLSMTIQGQTYQALWQQANDAEKQDLPRTQYEVLMKIVAKAQQEGQYGQLMAAELGGSRVMALIAPDSLQPAVDRMASRWRQAEDKGLKAVYGTVLKKICATNSHVEPPTGLAVTLDEETCQLLAAAKASDYKPLTVEGRDSRWFGDDMLSVIGYELQDYKPLNVYYNKVGNRIASLMTALNLLKQNRPQGDVPLKDAPYVQQLDSLIAQYGDLAECGEVAIERYNYMNSHTDAEASQLWDYTEQALSRWGSYSRMTTLLNAQQELTFSRFYASMDHRLGLPSSGQKLWLTQMRNIGELTMRLYKVKVNGDTNLTPNDKDDLKKLQSLATELTAQRVTRSYTGKRNYETFEDSILIPALPVGVYMVEIETQPQTEVVRRLYFVSNVRTMVETLPGTRQRYVVVDAQQGQPVAGAKILLTGYVSGRGSQKLATLTTDANGEAEYNYGKTRPTTVYTTTDNDKACLPMTGSGNFYYYPQQQRVERMQLMTDRAIYRPGQTVHVAAICYEVTDGINHRAVEGKQVRLTLRDANYKVVSEQTLPTDSYGSCATSFTLPATGLTGNFTIQSQNGSCNFRVEEYKRPTFEAKFEPFNGDYHEGDTIAVVAVARSYAGVPVQGARVKYRVERRRSYWWWSYSSYWNVGVIGEDTEDSCIAEGETTTLDDGTFGVSMPMVLPKTDYPVFFDFVCRADVTDQGGETHECFISLPLGNRATALTIGLSDKMRADQMEPVTFRLSNAAGNAVAGTVRYRIDNGKWLTAKTNTPVELPLLQSGRHTIVASVVEPAGNGAKREAETAAKQQFTIFALDDQRPAIETDDWFYLSQHQFPGDGSPVTVQVGSSASDVHIVYTIISGDSIIENGFADRSNQLINRRLTYKPEYGNGLLLTFAWVKQGRCYSHSATISRPLPDKQLKLRWQTFRNRLTPGQQEEWTLTVTMPDGRPADAQLMATLYDKSLDQFTPHSLPFYPSTSLSLPGTGWSFGQWGSISLRAVQQYSLGRVPRLEFYRFNESLFPDFFSLHKRNMFMRAVGASGGRLLEKASAPLAMVQEEAKVNESLAEVTLADGAAKDEIAVGAQKAPEVTVRENLQETAFFYPRLLTDSTGLVSLKFTLPESLTTWHFIGLAHTADLCYGRLSDEAVASKQLMVQPNMPRFMRQGDEATITARIVNTSPQALSGTAWLTLTDPDTEAAVLTAQAPFTVEAGQTTSAAFQVNCAMLSAQQSLLIAKVVATAGDYSDGEQHYLPILPNSELVTVTVPFTQHEPGTKAIDLTKVIPSTDRLLPGTTPKLTIEYTNNPVWLMVQALPAIGHPYDHCAVCQATSLYANSIGKHIIDQLPQAKTVFEQWKREASAVNTLSSQLEKNQELKDLVLSETPWVADADREAEQRQRLADFFDENLMAQRLASALEKVKKLQRTDGSWSWWPDMPGSTYMTVAVTEMLVRLNALTGKQATTEDMLDGAFRFLGRQTVELVDEMKRERINTFPSRTALEWLYICAIDGRTLPKSVQQANDFLAGLLKKEVKRQTIYEKALSAIILNSKTYVKSLKEYTVYKEEMGRYYDTPRAGYSWRDYRIPTQVAAIEALQRLAPDDYQTVSEMKRWLLQEKRTQAWDTPLNSVDAVYAFLSEKGIVNSEQLATAAATELKLDSQAIATPKPTAGIGYVKTAQPYHGEKLFTAEKTSQGTSWGAVYAQFMQPTVNIADQASGISVKRQVLQAGSLSPIDTRLTPLTVGTRVVVRLTIDSDRDLDFVQLSDKRAACMEPVSQKSGYNWRLGCYVTPRDNATNYFFDRLAKGHYVIDTEYYIDRAGTYETGTCTVQCAYAPEYRGTTHGEVLKIKK